MNKYFTLCVLVAFALIACGGIRNSSDEIFLGIMTDARDGKTYKTVQIGNQTWMAENLNYETSNSTCYKKSDSSCIKYGRLYVWKEAKDVCPDGWRLPTQEDWGNLFSAVGGVDSAGDMLKSKSGWFSDYNGLDKFAFNVLPAGYNVEPNFSVFVREGLGAFFWSFTDFDDFVANAELVLYNARNIGKLAVSKGVALSVRCIKGEYPIPGKSKMVETAPLIDSRDGQTYKTVKIGNQTWMAENLNYEMENSLCFNKDSTRCSKNGYYNWDDAMQACPAGWHLPNLEEWSILVSTAGGMDVAGKALRSAKGWFDNSLSYDDYGFSVLPPVSKYWSSTETGLSKAFHMEINGNFIGVLLNATDKSSVQGVRCIKDELDSSSTVSRDSSSVRPTEHGSRMEGSILIDSRDGQVYKTETYANLIWMTENLNYEMENSECFYRDVGNCIQYGRLYRWYEASEACPASWRLPTEKEWVEFLEKVNYNFGGSFWSSTNYDRLKMFALDWKRDQGTFLDGKDKDAKLAVRCVKEVDRRENYAESDSLSSLSSATVDAPRRSLGSVTDNRDGRTYKTVKIGSQTWMAENLKYETENSVCFNNDSIHCAKYGRFYKTGKLNTVCPSGWHLPTAVEWDTLMSAVGGISVAGKMLKSAENWHYCKPGPNKIDLKNGGYLCQANSGRLKNGNGTDDFGFSVEPAGFLDEEYVEKCDKVIFKDGFMTCFHSDEYADTTLEVEFCFRNCSDSVVRTKDYVNLELSVRCVKDSPKKKRQKIKPVSVVTPSSVVKGSLVDIRDGQTYKTVKIGRQTWMAQNLNYKTEKSLCVEEDSTDCKAFGRFYLWDDAMKACPAGWHLPTEKDWKRLIKAVGDSLTAGRALKSSSGWRGYRNHKGGGGKDEYGFSAFPVSYIQSINWGKEEYNPDNGEYAGFWSSKEFEGECDYEKCAYVWFIDYDKLQISAYEAPKEDGYSIRCVKD